MAAHLKHPAIGCRYANVYHHNRAKLIKDILCRKAIGTAEKFMPQVTIRQYPMTATNICASTLC